MVTILVSGSGTGVGKTRVTAALARSLAAAGKRVQIIKPVQTGISAGQPSDADEAATLAGIARTDAHTLRRFPAALAPVTAAIMAGARLDLAEIIAEIQQLPPADIRLLEGAGGLAVPLTPSGSDWADLSILLDVKAVVLVVPDQLGAINQARLTYDYYCHKDFKKIVSAWTGARRASLDFLGKFSPDLIEKAPAGIFLNALTPPPPEVATSTRDGLSDCQMPLWGELAANALEPRIAPPLAKLLGLV